MWHKSSMAYFVIGILLTGLAACERPISLDWQTTEGTPVLLALLDPSQPLELLLVRSRHPLDTNDFLPIDAADVRLLHGGEETVLQAVGDGLYLPPPDWKAYVGQRYRCEVVTTEGETLRSLWVKVPAEPTLQTWHYESNGYRPSSTGRVRDVLTLTIAASDSGIAYYELIVVGIKASGEGEALTPLRIGTNESTDAACEQGNQIFTSRCYPNQPLELSWAIAPTYASRDSNQGFRNVSYDSLLVMVVGLSEELYRYKTTLFADDLASVFFYTDTVYTNIQGGLGVLGAQATRILRIDL